MNHNCWFDWIEHSCDFDQLIMETSNGKDYRCQRDASRCQRDRSMTSQLLNKPSPNTSQSL